VRLLVEHLA